ncbi:hypothetical protein DACRYDRAFT_79220 [Dacryopinax primogenitus]|uniref:ATPase assembly factor ATP10 n=1 Tax=Dacryopinax primogenitus (strain DJM 731) TaxID=1858805 RepID=M5G2I2_DACPD|nr:uncharacterized protein DACRYDRAFT_79220 [Dacryopinax primogenitus]EJU02420.1 hypothetical protein DACRYDRAFT_79220 [Dacryopinax primogenitus]
MPLKFLDRPLGMALPPNTKHKLRQDVEADLAAREKKLKEREHLVKQVLTGYYNDVHQLKYHGGKRWIAPEVLVRADMALYFPDLEGTSLSENKTVHTTDLCKGKITILCIIGSQMAETHIAEYTKMVLTSFGNDPRFRFVQINLQENPLKAFLVSMFTRRIKSQVPPQYHATYLLSSYNMEYYREPLGCTNKMLGYVYLLDEDCKIRWAAGGHPNPEEQVSLHKCTGVLLKRLRQTGNTKASRPAVSSVQSTKGGKK